MKYVNEMRRGVFRRFCRKNVSVDLRFVNYIQFPENWVAQRFQGRIDRCTQVVEGSWDKVLAEKIYWSSRYEYDFYESYDWKKSSSMIPLGNYHFYNAIEERFLKNASWKETAWYQWLVERARTAPVSRYEGISAIHRRLGLMEKMFEEFRGGGYRSQNSNPIINVGRWGRIAIEDGRHRLCLAKLAGVGRVKVDISVGHIDAYYKKRFSVRPWQKIVDA